MGLLNPPDPYGGMGFIGIAFQASWYAVALDGGPALRFGLYMINCGCVLSAVSTAVVP